MNHSGYKLVLSIFLDQYKNKLPLTIAGDGKQTRDFVHVYDIITALYKCKNPTFNGKVLNVGSGKHYSVLDIVKMFNSKYKFIEKRHEPIIEPINLEKTEKILNWKPVKNLKKFIECQIN